MTSAQEIRARRWRWFWGFTFIFLTHAAAVFWFGQRVQQPGPPDRLKPLIYLPIDDVSAQRVADLAIVDPTLFALPSEKGFSGNAWLKHTPAPLAVSNWSAPPSWLTLNPNELGATLTAHAETNRISTETLLDGLRSTTPFELRVAALPLLSRSVMAIEGALNQRAFTLPVSLPAATNTDLLTNTVVEIAVNGDGIVESVMLAGECGSKLVDEAAVDVARQLAFAPLPLKRREREAALPERGRVIFTWQIVSPALTNGLTANASAPTP
jgi:hypothetical protein